MGDTTIQWTEKTWNPLRGCSIVSEGCHNCYAMRQGHRFSGPGGAYEGLTKRTKAGPQWTGKVAFVEDHLLDPLKWRAPKLVFVNSQSDLFHESVPDAWIDRIFAVMALAKRHTFQVLTKRAERMRAYMSDAGTRERVANVCGFEHEQPYSARVARAILSERFDVDPDVRWPLPNVWLGVSAENQERADERIPALLDTPAAIRFVSAEPLLGPIDFTLRGNRIPGWDEDWRYNVLSGEEWASPRDDNPERSQHLDWVIFGGEGIGARPCALEWIERGVQQCKAAGVAAFVKQLGACIVSEQRTAPQPLAQPRNKWDIAPNGEVWAWRAGTKDKKGGDPSEWPQEFPREMPRVSA